MKLRITLVVLAASLGLGWVFCGPTLNHEIRVWGGRRKLSPTDVSEIERTVRHKRWLAVGAFHSGDEYTFDLPI